MAQSPGARTVERTGFSAFSLPFSLKISSRQSSSTWDSIGQQVKLQKVASG